MTAELLSIGSELTAGEARDTNAGDLAGDLARRGVRVLRILALPDDLAAVEEAFRAAHDRADLVVSTGGLGPTPDDLTREAIAEALGEVPAVDPGLEAWLRGLWARRGMAFPEMNLKQAWRIPSARSLPNPNGTAPGWLVARPGGWTVALPGPPREMRPMWALALGELERFGLGGTQVVRTYRLAGIGESQVADLLGETMLRAANPVVATYARHDGVDIRVAAVAGVDGMFGDSAAGTADEIADRAEARILDVVGSHVWGRGGDTWPAAIGLELSRLGWSLAVREIDTGGSFVRLIGDVSWLARAEVVRSDGPIVADDGTDDDAGRGSEALRTTSGAAAGLLVRARSRGDDTEVVVAVATPDGTNVERRLAFLGGDQGRVRAGLTAAAILLDRLRAAQRATSIGRSR